MNDLLEVFRSKGKKKGYTFNEKLLKDEKVRINVELQDFIQKNGEAQKLINLLKENNINLKKQKQILINSVSSDDRKKINSIIQEIISQNSQHQQRIKAILDQNYIDFIRDIDSNSNISPQERRISKNLHGATLKNFQDIMIQFQSLESEL